MFNRHLMGALLLGTALFFPSVAYGQVSNAMDDFFNKHVTYTNVTQPGHYQSQTRNVFSLGRATKALPQVNTQLASASLPQINAGCGGIDAHFGSFSFINGEQIKDLFKAIMHNAEGLAFMVAIDIIDPLIGTEISKLQNMLQQVNSTNINSCDAATLLVDSLASRIPAAANDSCKRLGTLNGRFSDWAAAMSSCGTQGRDVIENAPEDQKKQTPVNRNFAFDASKTNSVYANNREMQELLVSIVGSIIVKQKDDGSYSYDFTAPIVLDEGAIHSLMYGGSLRVHKCMDDQCLDIQERAKSININADDAFALRVEDMLRNIYKKASGQVEGAYSDNEKGFIEETPLQVERAARAFASRSPEFGERMLVQFSDVIAYSMILDFMDEVVEDVINASIESPGGDKESLNTWRAQLYENKKAIRAERIKINNAYEANYRFIELVERMEGKSAARLLQIASEQTSDKGGL